MSVYNQVVDYAKQIKQGLNKIIYVDSKLKVHLINKNELPDEFYQKTAIVFVNNPKQYLREINKKEPTTQELSQFKLISNIYKEEPITQDEVYLPNELWEITLMNKPIEEIVKMRTLSKEWKNRIDSLWCKLIERDFKTKNYDKNDCMKGYILYKNFVTIPIKEIIDKAKEISLDEKLALSIIKDLGFLEYDGILYFEPKSFFNKDFYRNLSSRIISYRPHLFGSMSFDSSENKTLFKFYKFLKMINLKPFDVDHASLEFDYSTMFNMYEKVYGKGSFSKDFIIEGNKYFKQGKHKNSKTLQEVLYMIGSQIEYEGRIKNMVV